jgi:hypothetical protein
VIKDTHTLKQKAQNHAMFLAVVYFLTVFSVLMLPVEVGSKELVAGERTACHVIKVVDGDTLWLDCLHDEVVKAEQVHLYGITSPNGAMIHQDSCSRHPMRFKGFSINYYNLHDNRDELINIIPMHQNSAGDWVAKVFISAEHQQGMTDGTRVGPLYAQ